MELKKNPWTSTEYVEFLQNLINVFKAREFTTIFDEIVNSSLNFCWTKFAVALKNSLSLMKFDEGFYKDLFTCKKFSKLLRNFLKPNDVFYF